MRMAYDQALDDRVAEITMPWGAVRKTMFGGTGYMLNGHLLGGVYKQRLLVRLSAEAGADALNEPDTAPSI
jgi:TfoX/Sxy family transcriptional regulator of competence genes